MNGSILISSYFLEVIIKLIVILLVYILVMRFVVPFVRNDRWHDRVRFYAPIIRNIAIVILVVEVIANLAIVQPIVIVAVLAMIVLLFWGYLSNVFLGIVFKIQRGNLKGQGIRVSEFSGKILELKNAKIEVETEKGEILQIPYSKIVNEVEIKPSAAKNLKTCSVLLEVNEKAFKTLEKDVLREVGLMPYVVDTVLPKIEVIDQMSDLFKCKIIVFTNDDKFVPVIKSRLLKLVK